jgi:hypothetical protein
MLVVNAADWISIAGAALGLTGSLVLAYALDPALKMLRTHLEAIDVTVDAMTSPDRDGPVFVGFEQQHERTFKRATNRVKVGGWMLAMGFLAQVIATAGW